MKKELLYAMVSCAVLSSCSKKGELYEKSGTDKNVMINSLNQSNLRTTEYFDWETVNHIKLTNQNRDVTLPWKDGAQANIPQFVINDYKREDGWVLLYNYCTVPTDEGRNYLIFYNKFTGILRTFYYLSGGAKGSDGMWGIKFTNTNSLLNNSGYFAKPADFIPDDSSFYTTNLRSNSTNKAITNGWNAFDAEITYDPTVVNRPISFEINSYNKNTSNLIITGGFNSQSEGTIVSSSSNTSNPVQEAVNGVVGVVGGEAKDWVKNNIGGKSDNKIIKKLVGSAEKIVEGGVKEIINQGVNLLFGSFLGIFSSTTNTSTAQQIKFKTNGSVNFDGVIETNDANSVFPIQNIHFPGAQLPSNYVYASLDENVLGVWNIDHKPVVKFSRNIYAGAPPMDSPNPVSSLQYSREGYVDPSSFNIVVNPNIANDVTVETKVDLLYYHKFKGSLNWNGDTGRLPYKILDPESLLYQDGQNDIYSFTAEKFDVPTQQFPQDVLPMFGFDQRFVVKVTVILTPKAPYKGNKIVMTRSYLPSYAFYD